MTRMDFFRLSRQVQDRLVGAANAEYPPYPIAFRSAVSSVPVYWVGASLFGAVASIVVTNLGHGVLTSAWVVQPRAWGAIYAAALSLVVAGMLKSLGFLMARAKLPFRSGIYLFPACVIDATTTEFAVYPLDDAARAEVSGPNLIVRIGGQSFAFTLKDETAAQNAASQVETAKGELRAALQSADGGALVGLDPLHEPRFSSPVGPQQPFSRFLPPWLKYFWLVALATGGIVGMSLLAVRNKTSDDRSYAAARSANTVQSYQQYLSRGVRHRAEVADLLLPRAELREVGEKNDVAALYAYRDAHAASHILSEIDAALRAALARELETAKAAGSLAALEAYAKKYPNHPLKAEWRAAVHAVYARALEAYKQANPNRDKRTMAFVERLFAALERRGPNIEVRFRRKDTKTLGQADQAIAKTPYFMGEVSYPSKYFDSQDWPQREAAIFEALRAKLLAGLPAELISFSTATADEGKDANVPHLLVHYAVEWRGHTVSSSNPRGIWAGLVFVFDTAFSLADGAPAYAFTTEAYRPPPTAMLKDEEGKPATRAPGKKLEEAMYEQMAREAGEQFATRYAHLFVRPVKANP